MSDAEKTEPDWSAIKWQHIQRAIARCERETGITLHAFCKPARYEIGEPSVDGDTPPAIIVEPSGRSAAQFDDEQNAANAIDLVTDTFRAAIRDGRVAGPVEYAKTDQETMERPGFVVEEPSDELGKCRHIAKHTGPCIDRIRKALEPEEITLKVNLDTTEAMEKIDDMQRAAEPPAPVVNVHIQGSVLGATGLDELAKTIAERLKDAQVRGEIANGYHPKPSMRGN